MKTVSPPCAGVIVHGCLAAFLSVCSLLPMPAQTVGILTAPAGFMRLGAYDSSHNYLGLLGNSDTVIALPFTRPAEFVGTISSISSNVVTLNGTLGWTTNQFVYAAGSQPNTYYAVMGSNVWSIDPKEGSCYTVTANSANSVTLDLNGDSLDNVPGNTTITLIPYWTLNTVFPAANANVTFTPTTSLVSMQTQILIPNYAGTGINVAPVTSYYYYNNGANVGWRILGDQTTDHGDDILLRDGYIIFRQSDNAPTLPMTLSGSVVTGKVTLSLATLTSGPQDNSVYNMRPVDVSLVNSGLVPGVDLRISSSSSSPQDEVLFFSNSTVGFNKSPTVAYYYLNDGTNIGWRLVGDVTNDHGGDPIPGGSAMILRKAAADGNTVLWQSNPTY